MRGVRFAPSADDGLLVTFDEIGFDELHGLAAAVRDLEGVVAAVVGHSSLLVLAHGPETALTLGAALERVLSRGIAPRAAGDVARHELEVDFSEAHAPDFQLLLARAGLTRPELLARVEELELRARYLGFLPGFAYLEGWPEAWALPRRAAVRDRVPEGSLGIAGAMAGFYPGESPGGWNLVGRSGAALWDPFAARPNLIAAGDVVTIRPGALAAAAPRATGAPDEGEPVAELLAPGASTVVAGGADAARLRFGIAAGGVFDVPASKLANRLAGNDDGALLLECAALGPRLRFLRSASIAIAGASVEATVDGARIPPRALVDIPRGATLELGPIRDGMRCVVAFRGGLASAEPRWASRPRRLARGDVIGTARAEARRAPLPPSPAGDRLSIGVFAGPHEVAPRLLACLTDRSWCVTPALDRTGVRLASGPPPGELPALLPSCGMRFGAVQWLPGGELVVMGPDHPVTGGYLQPLTVPRGELWKVAQLAPGDVVRFAVRQVIGQRS